MVQETLYNHGLIIGKIADNETYRMRVDSIVAAVKALPGVFDVMDMPRMGTMCEADEIPFSVFIAQGTDLQSLAAQIHQVDGVSYADTSDDGLIRHPSSDSKQCATRGHQCSCGTGPK